MTLSEVIEVSGEKGNFSIKVKKNPRYVDVNKCIACNTCAEKCPKKVPDEFNMDISKRKAAYIKYAQTVPLKYAIDAEHCLYLTKGKCKACEKFCPTGAILFSDKEEIITLNVGSVILAPGFHSFDPSIYDFYNYNNIPDLVTGLEYERLLSAGGPCLGHLVRPSDNREPQKIAWVQCVGSRNINRYDNGYCSNVCCMYAIKQSLVTAEHLSSGKDIEETIFYIDIRTHGKEFEKYYEEAKNKGIKFIRALPHTVLPGKNGPGVRLRYTTIQGKQIDEYFDMVVLSTGIEPSKDVKLLSKQFGFDLNHYNFADTSCFAPVTSTKDGIYVTGSFLSPKDIPHSVTEASAAATGAAKALAESRGTLTKKKVYPVEIDISEDEVRIGVFVCSCGTNIAGVINVKNVMEYSKTLPNVVFAGNNLFTCSTDTQDIIAAKIKEHNLNRIVIAACTPRTHEPLFQSTLKEVGLNAYMVEMANIRNQNSWVHQNEPEKATQKAKDQVRMAAAKASLNYPLEQSSIKIIQNALVIGGGISGMTAALDLGDQGFETTLLEKNDKLGGNAWLLEKTWKGEEIRPMLQDLINKVENHDKLIVLKNAHLLSATGSVGDFESKVEINGESKVLKYGIAVIATGAKEYIPNEYMYGDDDDIMTHLQFDEKIRENQAPFKKANSIAFIQCVGSREPDHPYCSRVCCTHSVKSAIKLKELNPDMNVYILYRDIRTYGQREALYKKARELGVIFIRYSLENKPKVSKEGDDLFIEVLEPILQRSVKIFADFLVLASAIVPHENKELVELYKCGVNEDGFLNEAHPKLRPVEMSVDGLFVAGLCNYPKSIDESIEQAKAAVSRASIILSSKEMQLDAIKSFVTENCDGCALCIDVCPFLAIQLEEYERDGRNVKRIKTDKALCKGCGLCEATCPKGGVFVHGFTNDQLKAQVDAALETLSQ